MLVLNYKKQIGTIKDDQGFTYKIFQGNCLAGFTWDGKDEEGNKTRSLMGFWCDKKHLTNCLGLTGMHKGDNIHKGWTKISLNTRYPESKIIANAFMKARSATKIELFYK